MNQAVQSCKNCGAGLSLDDLRGANCRYCGTVLPHRAQAEQQAQLVGQVMNQMIGQQAQIQNQWRAGFGAPPMPMMPPGTPGLPYADAQRVAALSTAHAMRMSRVITYTVVAIIVGTFLLVGVIIFLTAMR
jgi:hypothetical protein